jgi:hypothetical protein
MAHRRVSGSRMALGAPPWRPLARPRNSLYGEHPSDNMGLLVRGVGLGGNRDRRGTLEYSRRCRPTARFAPRSVPPVPRDGRFATPSFPPARPRATLKPHCRDGGDRVFLLHVLMEGRSASAGEAIPADAEKRMWRGIGGWRSARGALRFGKIALPAGPATIRAGPRVRSPLHARVKPAERALMRLLHL